MGISPNTLEQSQKTPSFGKNEKTTLQDLLYFVSLSLLFLKIKKGVFIWNLVL